MMADKMGKKRGIYIHMPFCVKKCNYCGFLSFDAESSPRREYMEALCEEIKLRASGAAGEECSTDAGPIDTVYIGGGTPSVMDISQLSEMVKLLRKSYNIRPDAEFTLEANPGTLGRKDGVMLAKLQAYKFMRINRLSMGVQSMDNDRLHYLGRIHTAENVMHDMEIIRRKGFDNVNLDLMFSVPGESKRDAIDDLRKILEMKPEHISCYSLQIEEGTPFGIMAGKGDLIEVPDEDDRETFHSICRMLKEAGYEHYEISNFAKMPDGVKGLGFGEKGEGSPVRSGHNSLYWDMSDYIGLGLGASGFVNGIRYKNTSDLNEYINTFKAAGTSAGSLTAIPHEEHHINDSFDNISEAVFTGLRRREGISYEEAISAFIRGADQSETDKFISSPKSKFWSIFADAEEEARDFAAKGLLMVDDEGLRLTEQGIDISNTIMSLFV